ncbi:hypothetical protein [Pirellulimonas nuda]|uniref:hypothetical protein n=1 Tax=Pirellulimonas nuda TaxID=2528009 RepID=UPI0011A42A52|nr:hypothetical protein [Pirellulimonas nuda]
MLHETTQRRVCRTAFLTVCVLPTLLVAAWVGWRVQPGWRATRVAQIGHELAARLECRRLTTPRPGQWRLEGCVCLDLESGEELLRASRVDAWPLDGGWRVAVGEASLDITQLEHAAERTSHWLRSDWPGVVLASVDRLKVVDGDTALADWQGVRARLASLGEPDALTGRELSVVHHGVGGELTLLMQRNRQVTPATTRVTLSTGDTPLPVRLCAALIPCAPSLGDAATVTGRLVAHFEAEPHGEVQGELQCVDMALLTGGRFTTDAPGSVALNDLTWRGDKIASLDGVLSSGAGRVARPLVYAAYTKLGCAPSATFSEQWNTSTEQEVAFDRLVLALRLDETGFSLRGDEPQQGAAGVVLSRGGQPLLSEPTTTHLPLATLVQTLAPEGPAMLPASAEAGAITRRLPMPPAPR